MPEVESFCFFMAVLQLLVSCRYIIRSESLMSANLSGAWEDIPLPSSNTFNKHFWGSRYRNAGGSRVDVEFDVDPAASNEMGFIHGAYLAAAAEMVLSLPIWLTGTIEYGRAVTVDFDLKYVANLKAEGGLQAEVDLVHQTGRLGFVRGLLKQGETVLVSF